MTNVGTLFLRQMAPEVSGVVLCSLTYVTAVLLLHGQPTGAVNTTTNATAAESECSICSQHNCTTDCRFECDTGCGNYSYIFTRLPECPESHGRKRRQLPGATIHSLVTTSTALPTTTTQRWGFICKNCSIPGCLTCVDYSQEPACAKCHQDYLLDNATETCVPPGEEDNSLSGEAIAGIVIGVLCIVGILVVLALFLLKKFRGRNVFANVSERFSHAKPVANTVGNIANGGPQIPKINAKELLRKHDQITRYMKDPTIQDSLKKKDNFTRPSSREKKELDELGQAPAPPGVDPNTYTEMQQRYDRLDVINANDTQLYLSPDSAPPSQLYQNDSEVKTELSEAEGLYENTQKAKKQVTKASSVKPKTSTKHPALTVSQESVDLYEPVVTAAQVQESQEIYANDESAILVKNNQDDGGDIYMNENAEAADDVYMNT